MSRLPTEATDEMLMVRYQRGDREALAHLVRRHAPSVYSYANWVLGNASDARLVTEQVFVAVVGRTAEFKHEVRFTAWLYSMVRALCVQHGQQVSAPSLQPSAPTTPEPTPTEPSVDTTRSNASGRAADALADLPADQREALLLREIAHLPFAEIAAITESDADAVRSRIRHALERMHEAVVDTEEYARALR
ncbi:MAG: sigma-70 family RNA polymerase sigma factor [Polyangiaceae bacterium]|nr:sigma-70 family RNA polymerase sigma factor [Polyangiaceae bacterium]